MIRRSLKVVTVCLLFSLPSAAQYRRAWYRVLANAPLVEFTKTNQLIAADSRGGGYLVAQTSRARNNADIQVIKFNAEGATEWVRWITGTANRNDRAWAIAVDRADNLVLAGSVENSTTLRDAVVAKFSPTGEEIFSHQTNGRLNRNDEWRELLIGPGNNIYVTGGHNFTLADDSTASLIVEGRSATGAVLWSHETPDQSVVVGQNVLLAVRNAPVSLKGGTKTPGAGTKEAAASLVTIAFEFAGGAPDLVLKQYDLLSGRISVTRKFYARQFAGQSTPGETGYRYVGTFRLIKQLYVAPGGELTLMGDCVRDGGFRDSDLGACLVRFSNANSVVWTSRFEPENREGGISRSLAVDRTGNCYLGGINYAEITPGRVNGFVARINNSGGLEWQISDSRLAYLEGGLLLDPSGNIIALGRSNELGDSRSRLSVVSVPPSGGPAGLIEMLDLSTYEASPGVRFASHNTRPYAAVLASDGSILVGGQFGAPGFGGNLLVKYRRGKL